MFVTILIQLWEFFVELKKQECLTIPVPAFSEPSMDPQSMQSILFRYSIWKPLLKLFREKDDAPSRP